MPIGGAVLNDRYALRCCSPRIRRKCRGELPQGPKIWRLKPIATFDLGKHANSPWMLYAYAGVQKVRIYRQTPFYGVSSQYGYALFGDLVGATAINSGIAAYGSVGLATR